MSRYFGESVSTGLYEVGYSLFYYLLLLLLTLLALTIRCHAYSSVYTSTVPLSYTVLFWTLQRALCSASISTLCAACSAGKRATRHIREKGRVTQFSSCTAHPFPFKNIDLSQQNAGKWWQWIFAFVFLLPSINLPSIYYLPLILWLSMFQ